MFTLLPENEHDVSNEYSMDDTRIPMPESSNEEQNKSKLTTKIYRGSYPIHYVSASKSISIGLVIFTMIAIGVCYIIARSKSINQIDLTLLFIGTFFFWVGWIVIYFFANDNCMYGCITCSAMIPGSIFIIASGSGGILFYILYVVIMLGMIYTGCIYKRTLQKNSALRKDNWVYNMDDDARFDYGLSNFTRNEYNNGHMDYDIELLIYQYFKEMCLVEKD